MKNDPWYKTTLPLKIFDAALAFDIPHDVFSTQRIDEGTILFLEHLPKREPKSVLDMGCGYGALGLPIASRFKNAFVDMVDRDLLAVKWAAENAKKNKLQNVKVFGSLGFRDIEQEKKYDWILCNIPARIGKAFIKQFLSAGRARLSSDGELSVVVIRDLGPMIEELAKELSAPLIESGRGPRHVVYSMTSSNDAVVADSEDLYVYDTVSVGGLKLERPFDLGGDEPRRLAVSLPILIDALPRQAPKRVLSIRGGYGAMALTARTRWPQAQVTMIDRDLLGATFARRNVAGLKVVEAADFRDVIESEEPYDLIVAELSPSAGDKVARAELEAIKGALTVDGQALLLIPDKLLKEWKLPLSTMISREGFTVSRVSKR